MRGRSSFWPRPRARHPSRQENPIRKISLTILTAAVMAAPAGAADRQTKMAYFMHRCADHPTRAVLACIHRATIQYRVSYRQGKQIAWRESRLDPTPGPTGCNLHPIYNGEHACGLFEFIPSTWRSTPYARYSYFSAKWSSLAYAWMIKVGRCNEFATC